MNTNKYDKKIISLDASEVFNEPYSKRFGFLSVFLVVVVEQIN